MFPQDEQGDESPLIAALAKMVGGRPRRGPSLFDVMRGRTPANVPASPMVEAIPLEQPNLANLPDAPVVPKVTPSFADKTAAATSRAMWDQGIASAPLAVATPINRLWQALKGSADTAGKALGVPDWMMERNLVDPVGGFTSGAEDLAGKFHDVASRLGRGMIERDPAGRAALEELQGDVKKFQSIQDRVTSGNLAAAKELTDPRLMVPNMASLIPSLAQAYILGPTAGATTMTMGDASSSLREHEQRAGQVPVEQAFRYLMTRAGEIPMEALSNRLILKPTPGVGRIPAAATAGLVDPGTEAAQRFVENLAAKSTFAPKTRLDEGLLQEAAGAAGSSAVAASTAKPAPPQPIPPPAPAPIPATTPFSGAPGAPALGRQVDVSATPAAQADRAQGVTSRGDRASFLYDPSAALSDEERQIEKRFGERIGGDVASAVREYETRNTQNGTLVINTDQARDLSEDYNRDIESRSLYAAAVHEPASALVKRVWKDALARPPAQGKEANVVFTAGGTGAGKTTAIDNVPAVAQLRDSSDIIYDGNLNNFEKATQRIEEALSSGRTADIVYVYRDPIEAMRNGALPRAERQGRTVRIDAHADSHIGSLKVVSQLMERYKDDPRVNIVVLDNSRGPGGAVETTIDKLPAWEYDALAQELINVVQADYEAGRISDRVRRGTLGQLATLPRGAEPRLQEGDPGKPQPQRTGQSGQAQEVTAEQDRTQGVGDRTAGLTDTLYKGREASGKLVAERTGKRAILGIAKYIKANPESGVNFANERVSGFPVFVNTAQDFEKEVLRAVDDVKNKGLKDDALWYETAGRVIWKYADGDMKRADTMTRLTAKFAQTMGIRENTTALIQALEQMRKGELIKAGRYPNVMRKEIDALLAAKEVNIGVPGINRKLASFYWNLWDEVLLAAGKNELRPHLATVDQHINSYAQHQKINDVSPQEYAYSDMLMREATRRLNKDGYGYKLIGRALRPKEVQAALWGLHKKHVDSSGLGTNQKAVSESAWNYPEYMARATDVVQAETVPSSKVSNVSAMPGEARQQYHEEAVKVLRHGGVDDLANRLGVTRYSFESSGGYDGSINPNIVVGVLASKASRQSGSADQYHRFTHDAARLYALAWQYVYRQDAVPFYRADISIDPADFDAARARRQENIAKGRALKKDQYDVPMMSLGFDIVFKNGLTDQLERDTFVLLRQALGDSIGYTRTGHDSITVINYRDGETGAPFLAEDAEFEQKINEVTRGNADVDHIVRFGAETYYEEHDWKADPAGAALEDKIRAAGRPDLLEWLRGRREVADKVTAKYEPAGTAEEGRAQGVEENAFYGRRQIDALDVGRNKADHPAVTYALPGSMGRRRNVAAPETAHRKMLNSAVHDIEAAGFPVKAAMQAVRGVVTYNGDYSHWHAAWLAEHRVIGVSEMRLMEMEGSESRQRYLRGWLAHELTHAIDDAGNGSISSGSPRLDFFVAGDSFIAKGDVITEVAEAYGKGGKVGEYLEYPMAYAKEFPAATMKEEVLAQLSRLYTTNRELMQRELPVSFRMMEEWYAQIQSDSLAAARAGLQDALRSPRTGMGGQERQLRGERPAVAGEDRTVLGVGDAGAGVAGGGGVADQRGQGAVGRKRGEVLIQSAYSGNKYAVNLNLDRLKTAGDIKGLIEATAKTITPAGSRGPTATHASTLAAADKLGISEDQVLAAAKKGGTSMTLEQARAYALAVRQLLVTRAEATKYLAAEAVREDATPQDKAEALASLYQLAAIQAVGTNLAAEAGRLLNSYRIMADVTTGDRMTDTSDPSLQATAEQVMENIFGGQKSVDDVLRMVALMGTRQLASGGMRKALLSRRPSAFLEVWKAGLLSGPQTHIVNMVSNALTSAFRIPETALAAAIGKLHGGEKVYAREATALMAGMMQGALKGGADAWQILLHGEEQNAAGKQETHGKAITGENFGLTGTAGKAVDVAGEVVRTPFRALAAEDALFKGINQHGTLWSLAYRQAISEGARDVGARARQLLANPSKAMLKAAIDDGLYFTYNNKLGQTGQSFMGLLHGTPGGRLAQFLVVPFFRTPMNILKFAAHRSPIAPLTPKFREDFKAGGARRDMAISRMLTGTALATTAFMLASAGLISGGGEPEKERKATQRMAGWQPYSIKVGDKWVEYRRLEPLGMLLGMSASMAELFKYMSEEEHDHWLKMAGIAFADNITSKTFLSQLTNLIKTIDEPERYGDNYIGAMLGSFVPGAVGQYARARDPIVRDTDPDKNLEGLAYAWDDFSKDLQARIPGQREKLPPKYDALGKPIKTTDAPGYINPFRVSDTSKADPVAKEMADARARTSPTKDMIRGVRLTPDEKEVYAKASGTVTRARLEALFASPAYQARPTWLKDEEIKKVVDKSRANVRDAIIKGVPADRRVEAKIKQLRR